MKICWIPDAGRWWYWDKEAWTLEKTPGYWRLQSSKSSHSNETEGGWNKCHDSNSNDKLIDIRQGISNGIYNAWVTWNPCLAAIFNSLDEAEFRIFSKNTFDVRHFIPEKFNLDCVAKRIENFDEQRTPWIYVTCRRLQNHPDFAFFVVSCSKDVTQRRRRCTGKWFSGGVTLITVEWPNIQTQAMERYPKLH